jgi:transcriptional regulator NrdR family protein
MVKVKKRDGREEDFKESKLEASIEKAGATIEQAKQVAKTVATKIANLVVVTSDKISEYVVTALRAINKKAADAYVAYQKKKLQQKKKKK